MKNKRRNLLSLTLASLALTWSISSAPIAHANVYCLKNVNGNTHPAKTLWSQEDQYTNRAGTVWLEYDAVNRCGFAVQGWEYRLEIIDIFGDTIFSGTGKVWLKKPVAPNKSIKANRKGGYGVFDLYGSSWKSFQDWRRQRKDNPSSAATWRYTVIKTA